MQHVRRTTADQKRAGAGHRGKGFGGTRRLIALLLLVPTVMVQAATATSADAAVVAGFEIDGNTPVDGGGLDWATTGTHSTDPTGNVDDSNFTGGSKEFQNPNAWDEGTGTSTDQGDISDVWSHFITGAQTWGFLGFQRIKETGTMTFMVEFNQKANLPKQTDDSVQFRPDRTVNDLLLRFEQDGNDSFELTAAYKWTQSAAGSFASGCFTVPGYATPSAWCPTSVAGSGFAGATSVDGLFAEAAVNLSSFDSAGDCRGAFGTMNVRSFAGDSESSSLLDFVGGVGINVPPTCGQLVINKKDQFGTAVGGATFTITPNPIPGVTGPAAAELVVTDGAAPGIDTVADGTVTISPAKPGTYTAEETATPAGYQPDTTVHTDVVVGDSGTSVATVAFLNKLYFKPLDIANQASGSYGVEYDWLVHKTVVGASSKTVDEGQSATFQYQVELEALPEGPPAGKEVHGTATVTNPNSASHPDMRATLSITGDLACHFLPSNGAIDVDPGTAGVQVDAGDGSTAYDYTCDPGAGALVGGTTTAEVSWDQSTYPQAGAHPGEATAQASYAITVQPKIDELASVTDRFDGNPATPIGAAQYTWSDVWGADNHRVVVATYSSPAVGGTAGSCTDYPNVARVDESDTDDFDTSEQTVTLCVDLDDLVVTKTANPTFARDYDWSIEKSVTGDSSQTVPEGTPATFEYDVVVTPSGGTDTEFVVAGAIKVNNPNQRTITGVSLSDSLPGGTCTIDKPDGPLSIPAGNTSFPYTCVMSDATASTTGTNSATATWDASAFHGTSGTASGQAAFDFADATVTETDETATVTDTQVELGDVPGGVLVNAVDGPQTFTYTKDFDGEPGACTSYDNTAKVVATDSEDSASDTETVEVCVDLDDLVVSKTAKPTLARDYDWSIEKSVTGEPSQTVPAGTSATFEYDVVVTPSAAKDSAFVVSGVITVENPNATTISGVSLVDSLPGGTCTVDKPDGPLTVEPGTSVFDYSCELANATASTTGTNTATATWDASAYYGTDGSASGEAAFDFADAVADTTDETATVTDTQVELGDVPGGVLVNAADGPQTFTYTKDFDGEPGTCTTYDNTAKVVATDSHESDSDTQTVEVCVEKPLELAPTATADLARDYAWSIGKVADATQRTVDGSGTATFTYTVTARAGAVTESGWKVQGSVTVDNPNQYADGDITADVTAATTMGGGSVCTVAGGADVVIAEDSSATLPITCTFSSKPAGSGTVSVTATWDPAGEATSTSVTESTGPITFGVRSETNKTVQVVDDKTVAGQRVVLDPALTWAEGLVKSYTYSLSLAGGAAGACQSWTNTATIDQPVGPDPTASAVVLVCTPVVEVLPEQAFGKAVGSVKASCQGTVRAKLRNRSGERVVYKLRVGKKMHKVAVKAQAKRKFVTTGKARAKVTLKVGSTRLDKLRIPARCQAPEVLPETGMRAAGE